MKTIHASQAADIIKLVRERLGKRWVIAAPLGLGKPNRLLNALYDEANADPKVEMKLLTALSLARPRPGSDLEQRFLGPLLKRWWGDDYPDLQYLSDLKRGQLPANVELHEFYIQSGALLGNSYAQRNYISVNYTHVARDVAAFGVNLLVQMVARRETPQGPRYSLSCNTDVSFDLKDILAREGRQVLTIGVVHPELPFVGNDAEVGPEFFDAVLDDPGHRLFALPRQPVEDAEFALGLHASTLVKDAGTLQIGIGALSDALVYALTLRQHQNSSYRQAVEPLMDAHGKLLAAKWGGLAPLQEGLYGASEMVMDGFMYLHQAGILKRRVYDLLPLQKLLNHGHIREILRADDVEALIGGGVYPRQWSAAAVEQLIELNLLPAGTRLRLPDGLQLPEGDLLDLELAQPASKARLGLWLDGRRLGGGRYLHGAFYLGSAALYDWLRGLEGEDYSGLCMTRVSHINELYGGLEELHKAQRHEARFFNTCMMHTLLGAAVSDGLESGQVVSGVGGQYNFVAMAHAMQNGRSALMLRSTRSSGGKTTSSILFNYGHSTIPRHLRDLVITEYGIADLRGQTDEEVIKRLLAISDARFQPSLVQQAQAAGKLDPGFVIPERWKRNTPETIQAALAPAKAAGLFKLFPFGSDFDAVEERLVPALRWLKAESTRSLGKLRMLRHALSAGAPRPEEAVYLERLQLARPANRAERLTRGAVLAALRATASA